MCPVYYSREFIYKVEKTGGIVLTNLVWATYGFVLDDDKIWFASYWNNVLCCYSLKEKRVERAEIIPEDDEVELSFSNLVKVGNEIVIIPANALNIYIYDIEERKFSKIELGEGNVGFNKFFGYGLWKENIFLFPGKCTEILKINLITKKISHIKEWNKKIETDGEIVCFQFDHYVCGEKVYLLSAVTNKVLIFNMATEEEEIISVGEKNKIYSTITYLDIDKFLLTDEEGNCILLNLKDSSFEIIKNTVEGFISHKYDTKRACMSDGVKWENCVYLFPAQANKILKLSLIDNTLSEVVLNCDIPSMSWKGESFSLFERQRNYIYGFWIDKRILISMNLETEEVEYIPIEVDSLNEKQLLDTLFQRLKKGSVQESVAPFATLEMIIKCLENKNFGTNEIKEIIIGKEIYLNLKEELEKANKGDNI